MGSCFTFGLWRFFHYSPLHHTPPIQGFGSTHSAKEEWLSSFESDNPQTGFLCRILTVLFSLLFRLPKKVATV